MQFINHYLYVHEEIAISVLWNEQMGGGVSPLLPRWSNLSLTPGSEKHRKNVIHTAIKCILFIVPRYIGEYRYHPETGTYMTPERGVFEYRKLHTAVIFGIYYM